MVGRDQCYTQGLSLYLALSFVGEPGSPLGYLGRYAATSSKCVCLETKNLGRRNMDLITTIINGSLSGAVGALVGSLVTLYFTTKIKSKIQNHYNEKLETHKSALQESMEKEIERFTIRAKEEGDIKRIKWEIKRETCLKALKLVDGFWSNQDWSGKDQQNREVEVMKQQMPSIEETRECYNRLCLACDSPTVLRLFKICLKLDSGGFELTADKLLELRNEIRVELGFGNAIDFDRDSAFIVAIGKKEN